MATNLRIGEGWDRHPLRLGEHLVLAGVKLDSEVGTVGHSDADPAIHAVIDAYLGACGEGDIGSFFPPSDDRWQAADSLDLLDRIQDRLGPQPPTVINLDLTVILEGLKLAPYRDEMCDVLRHRLPGDPQVNVAFSTAEELGPVGRGEAVDARAVMLVECNGG